MKLTPTRKYCMIYFILLPSALLAEMVDQESAFLQQSLQSLSREHAIEPPLTINRCISIIGQSEISILSDDNRLLLSICESAGMLTSPNFFTYNPDPLDPTSPDEQAEEELFDFFDDRAWWSV